MTSIPPSVASLRGAVDLSSLVNRPAGGQAGASGAASGLVIDVTDASFSAVLDLSNTVPVIVELRGAECEPCDQLSPVLESLVREHGGRLVLARVDIDASPQLREAFQAQSIPTVAAVIGGRPVALFSGAYPEAEVRGVLDQVLQLAAQNGISGRVDPGEDAPESEAAEEPLPPHHAEAYDAITRGDYASAIREYQTAIAQNPNDDLARAGLAQVRLLARLAERTIDEIRSEAAERPTDVDAQLSVADLDVSGGHVEDAFARLLDLYPSLDAERKEIVRQRLLEFFEIVGATDPRVTKARQRLASLLY